MFGEDRFLFVSFFFNAKVAKTVTTSTVIVLKVRYSGTVGEGLGWVVLFGWLVVGEDEDAVDFGLDVDVGELDCVGVPVSGGGVVDVVEVDVEVGVDGDEVVDCGVVPVILSALSFMV